jgi:hypothetical protein
VRRRVVVLRAAVLRAAGFRAVVFRAAGFLAVVFRRAGFLAVVFRAVVFRAVVFRAAGFRAVFLRVDARFTVRVAALAARRGFVLFTPAMSFSPRGDGGLYSVACESNTMCKTPPDTHAVCIPVSVTERL